MRVPSALTLAVLLGALVLAPVATAQIAADAAPPLEATSTTDSWLGGLAAVGCGVFVRASIVTAGTQVGLIAGAIACCAYAFVDLVFIDPR